MRRWFASRGEMFSAGLPAHVRERKMFSLSAFIAEGYGQLVAYRLQPECSRGLGADTSWVRRARWQKRIADLRRWTGASSARLRARAARRRTRKARRTSGRARKRARPA